MALVNGIQYEGSSGTLKIQSAAPGVSLVVFSGYDSGEFGQAPFEILEKEIAGHHEIDLFIDARAGRAASINVSGEWARWLQSRKKSLRQVSMLTGSHFVKLSADFVRRFAELNDIMKIYTEAEAFDAGLSSAVSRASEPLIIRQEGKSGALRILRPAPAVALVIISGYDTGEFGKAAFIALEKEIADHSEIELFIDARDVRAASIDVSGEWANWMQSRKAHLRQISMLTGSRFIKLSADFVRRFAELGDKMKVYTEAHAFEADLAASIARE